MLPRPEFAPEGEHRQDDRPEGQGGLSNALLKAFDSTSYAIMVADVTPRIVAINRAFTTITGWSREQVVGRNPSMLSSGRQDAAFYEAMWRDLTHKHHWQGEIWNRRKDGSIFPEWLTIDAVLSDEGDMTHYVAVFADITKRKQESDALEQLAFHDPLTGLPNRRLFEDRLENALARARRDSLRCALIAIDLDGFKAVNDDHGHDIGDKLLVAVADRMSCTMRASDTLARVGGDEFRIMIPSIKDDCDVLTVAQKFHQAISKPYKFLGRETPVGASLGVCIFPEHGASSSDLMKAADRAMYQAKDDGKGVIRMASAPL